MRISDWSSDVCSSDLRCLEKFRAVPEDYLRPREEREPARPVAKGATYTCPMHPEVEQEGPGDCPKCGMALEPAGVPASRTRTQYTCPMHPEIVRDEPGNCPICGMALEPMTVAVEEGRSEEHTSELQSLMRISYAVVYM